MAFKLIKVAREFNVGLHTIVETLHAHGFSNVEDKPTAEITDAMLVVLRKEFQKDVIIQNEADKLARPVLKMPQVNEDDSVPPPVPPPPGRTIHKEENASNLSEEETKAIPRERPALRIVDKIDLDATKKTPPLSPPPPDKNTNTLKTTRDQDESAKIRVDAPQSRGLKILGRLDILIIKKIENCKKNKSKFLDLGNCNINSETILYELYKLTWLEGLNFSSRFKHPETGKWQNSENYGTKNKLTKRGIVGIENLKKLKYLDLSDCGVDNIEPLAELKNLSELRLNDNKISSLDALSKLTNLTILDISKNSIEDVTPISGLSNLYHLDIAFNSIYEIPDLYQLTSLVELRLANNKISDLRSLYALSKLKTLDISGNEVENIFPISRLDNLERLEARDNKINSIKSLRELPKLSALNLDANPIQDCPVEVWSSNDIRQIRAYFNSLSRQERKGDTQASIDKSRNTEIKLILVGNSGVGKTQLAEILMTGQYVDNRDTTHGIKVHRWRPDKNSIKPFDELPPGFLVNIWDFGGQEYYHGTHQLFLSNQAVYVLLWDKNTNRNGIVPTKIKDNLVADLDHFHFRYWLESIRHYAPDSPILIVQNKIDDPEQPRERLPNEDLELFEVEYDGTALSLQMAFSEDIRYQRLFSKFSEDLAEQLDKVAKGLPFNPAWLKIKNAIQELGDGNSNAFSKALKNDAWMGIGKFKKVCKEIDKNLTDDELYTLPSWLDRIGTLIYYPNNPTLNRWVYLKPEWITENIYNILNETVLKQHGEFNIDDLPEELAPFANTFIAMMKEMEIIFPHPYKENSFVAPQYLPEEHAIEDLFAIAELGLRQSSYRIRVPLFFYRKLMHRLIIYFGIEADVTAKYYWKHGIVLVTQGGTRCLIKGLYPEENQQEGVILVGIEKTDEFSGLQKEIFERILLILSGREKDTNLSVHPVALGVKSQIASNPKFAKDMDPEAVADIVFYNTPFPPGWTEQYFSGDYDIPRWLAVLEVAVGDSDFIHYLELCQSAKNGMTKITMKNRQVELIKNFECLLDRHVAKPIKVFLSYSHHDLHLMRRLDVHLAPLKRLEKIESWNDRDILPGMDWDATIRRQLNEADIILLLITADFVASEYIWEKELAASMERLSSDQCRVIPILLQPVDFAGLPFTEGQMIPFIEEEGKRNLRAVALWNSQEEGFSEVAKAIRKVIDEMSNELAM